MSEKQGLAPIKSVHLKDVAYEALHSAITNLDLMPGQAISENMLVEQLGVSKTPIRAALGRLEAEGMVETVPFKGTFVSSVDDEDARDLIELRTALEVASATAACERATDEQLEELRQFARTAYRQEAAGEHESALNDIGEFHDRLVRLSGNARLESAYSALKGPIKRIRALSGAEPDSINASSGDHEKIVEAVAARDAELSALLVKEHLHRVLDLYLKSREVDPAPGE